jgi:hypothetical protein
MRIFRYTDRLHSWGSAPILDILFQILIYLQGLKKSWNYFELSHWHVGPSIDLRLLDTETYFCPLKDRWDLLGSSRPIRAHKFPPSSPLILLVPVRVSPPPLPPPSRFLKDGQGWEEPWPVSTCLSTKAGRIRQVHLGIQRQGGAWGQRGPGDPLRRWATAWGQRGTGYPLRLRARAERHRTAEDALWLRRCCRCRK